MTNHDDLPHPVPPLAFLRWKENYFFIILSPDSGIFGLVHLNFEPGFARARFTCNLSIEGQVVQYSNTTDFPADFEMSRSLGDGRISLTFVQPHGRFDLAVRTDEVALDAVFEARFPTYDYAASKTAAPETPSFQEVMTLGTNLPYNHQQQSLSVRGSVRRLADAKAFDIAGYGYRDHSWCMRTDNIVSEHSWCAFNLPSLALGAKTITTLHRPGLWAREGYVADRDGVRALRRIVTRREGEGPDGLPARLVHEVEDVFGRRLTIEADLAARHAHVPLVAEAPGGGASYRIVENFCPIRVRETGEEGVALVEMGRSSAHERAAA
ncbi:hypothetical protein [Sphingosinicella terrae]|uniref:DUF7064 domain-containing protein n=1 Tax=Sphingosinicella terrae TaxID=2172047 RepID=UPI0013B3FD0D|nr:hypothetical protein [Sphingosinicella terrae]